MHALPKIAVAAMLLLVSCTPGGDGGEGRESPTSPQPTVPGFATCANAEAGYELAYPADWSTNSGEVIAACTVFHPEPFELEPQTEIPHRLAVRILVEAVPFETAVSPPGERELESEPTEVDGRSAVRAEVEVTQAAAIPAGTRMYRYVVDLGNRTLIASTNDLGDVAYAEKKRVLDRMMRDLTFVGDTDGEGEEAVGRPRTEPYETEGFPSGDGPPRLLSDVRVAGHQGFDRVVFEFADAEDAPQFRIEWEERPIREDPSGRRVEVEGQAFAAIRMIPASGVDLSGEEPEQTYTGPDRIRPPFGTVITEAVRTSDFEATLEWVVGLERQVPYGFTTLEDPVRLVIDFRTTS